MIFSSLIFTFYFLPVVIGLYYVSNKRFKNIILLIASLLFYAYGEPKFVFVMIASIIINYSGAILIEMMPTSTKKMGLLFVVLLDLGLLYIFKYLDFTFKIFQDLFGKGINPIGISLPIGISFFTFQALSYVVDVYKGRTKVQKNIFNLALYISFFPQLIAGPIVRYTSIEEQIEFRTESLEKFAIGARRFMIGFIKKVLVANNVAVVSEYVFGMNPETANMYILWIGAIAYTLQIYYDFSGYSDMAIGLAGMFGFSIDENFNYPYIAKSITDFWRRWHISLSQWFRDYVYIPLGGSRCSLCKQIRNLFVVWLLTGIWHGANYTFIVWGLIYFVFLVIEKYIVKLDERGKIFKCIWRILTIVVVIFNWVIFNSESLNQAIKYCVGMCGLYGAEFSLAELMNYRIQNYYIYIIIGAVFATPIYKVLKPKCSIVWYVLEMAAVMFLFIWSVSFLVLGAHNPFIYFNF